MQRKSNNEVDHMRFYGVLNLGQILRLTSHEVDHTKVIYVAQKVHSSLNLFSIFGHCMFDRLNFHIVG